MEQDQEQQGSQEQLADLLQKIGEEVKKVEKLRTQVNEEWPMTPLKKEVSDASFYDGTDADLAKSSTG